MITPASESSPSPEQTRWFLEEVHTHESSLRSYLRSCFPGNREVDDVVQESFLRVWRARAMRPIQSPKSFLFQVARYLAIDAARRNRICPVRSVTDMAGLLVLDDTANAREAACTRDEIALLAAAIDSLPNRCREILILRKLRGVPQNAIAAQLGISVQTVQVHVHRGLKRIARYLAENQANRSQAK